MEHVGGLNSASHLWTPLSVQAIFVRLWRVVGCCHLSGLGAARWLLARMGVCAAAGRDDEAITTARWLTGNFQHAKGAKREGSFSQASLVVL